MVTIGPIQPYPIIAAIVVLVAVVGIIFAQAFKMGFKYGSDYEKSRYRRRNEAKRRKQISQYYRNNKYDTNDEFIRIRKPIQ